MPPTLQLVKTLWGVDDATDDSRWDALFARIKSEGFSAVEAIAPTWRKDKAKFCSLLEKHGLKLVCQIHTTGGDIDAKTGEYLYCTSNKLHDHLGSFTRLVAECANLPLKPVFINSHSGHDSWGSGDKAVAFFKKALQIEAALGVKVVHETHRQRLLYSPYSTAELLAMPDLAALKVNADMSHWCCVCEHVFDANDPRDDFWQPLLAAVAKHCHFVHCRVGHAEGPQVNDPDAPEHQAAVDAHFAWWRSIWQAQAARATDGEVMWAEPEFGPPPYLQTLPFTAAPVADLWDINRRVAARVQTEYAASMAAEAKPADGADGAPAIAHWRTDAEAVKARAAAAAKASPSPDDGDEPALAGSLLALATGKEAAHKQAKEAAKAKAAAKEAAERLKEAEKEGGKKGVEIEAATKKGEATPATHRTLGGAAASRRGLCPAPSPTPTPAPRCMHIWPPLHALSLPLHKRALVARGY